MPSKDVTPYPNMTQFVVLSPSHSRRMSEAVGSESAPSHWSEWGSWLLRSVPSFSLPLHQRTHPQTTHRHHHPPEGKHCPPNKGTIQSVSLLSNKDTEIQFKTKELFKVHHYSVTRILSNPQDILKVKFKFKINKTWTYICKRVDKFHDSKVNGVT